MQRGFFAGRFQGHTASQKNEMWRGQTKHAWQMRKSILLFGFLFIWAVSLNLFAQLNPDYTYPSQQQISFHQDQLIHRFVQNYVDKESLTDLPLEAKISMACLAGGIATLITSFIIYNRAYWDLKTQKSTLAGMITGGSIACLSAVSLNVIIFRYTIKQQQAVRRGQNENRKMVDF